MWNDFIDNYCERLGPGLTAEPLNAITNLAFIFAAIMMVKFAKNHNALRYDTLLLSSLIFIIGLGSAAFHTFATYWALLADSLPILIYQIVFLVLYTKNVMHISCKYRWIPLGVFILMMYGFGRLPSDWLNGSLQYAPALIFTAGMGIYHLISKQQERYALLMAAGVFTISLTFRSLDMELCETIPMGSHFLWHCLNAVVLYMTARAYCLMPRRSTKTCVHYGKFLVKFLSIR